jgi:bacitracin synthase 3
MSQAEKKQVVFSLNDTEAVYPEDKTIHQLFEEQVERTPDHIALVGTAPEVPRGCPVYLTYHELNEKSGRLAGLLIEKGVLADNIVGIMVERSVEMIVGILGILKSGGAYLPIDPGYPQERIDYMLKDSGAKLLVTTKNKEGEKVRRWEGEKYEIEDLLRSSYLLTLSPSSSASSAVKNLLPATGCWQPITSLAYIIYTSGSTGRPKGVMVEHRSVVNYTWWAVKHYVKGENVNFPLYTSMVFDLTVTSLFVPLITGNSIIVYRREKGETPIDTIEQIIRDERIGVVKLTPAHLKIVKEMQLENTSRIKRLILGGENLESRLIDEIHKKFDGKVAIYNEYGPTEATVGCMIHLFDPGKDRRPSVPIGLPADNLRVFILDKFLRPVSTGVTGELCISGAGLARGYLNQPDLTAEKFISFTHELHKLHEYEKKNPKSKTQNSRLYLTGDTARWLEEGNIEFLGRIDHQVKIRGFRVELGEIENRLLNHRGVKDAVVLIREVDRGDKYLCAYIVTAGELAVAELQEYLSKEFPDYMIPSYFVRLEKIPLIPNGKVDWKALPKPELKAGEDYIGPRDELEKRLVELWSDVLGIEEDVISINSNFFRLGGHSLKATIVTSRIKKEFDVYIPLVELFKTPTIRQLAGYIKNKGKKAFSATDSNLVLLRETSEKAHHLFFIHDGSGEVEGYVEFCQQLDTDTDLDFNCWGIQADKIKSYAPQNTTIEEIAGKYIEKIKSLQPQGPFFISGWSIGGTIAFEMVRQLEQMKEKIALLALIDSPGPLKHPNKNILSFNHDSEKRFIKKYLVDKEIEEKIENTADINQTWSFIINYLESREFDIEMIKKVIVEYEAHVVPHFNQLKIKELIKYLNVGRTFKHARNLYTPAGKIHTPVHYFAATQSKKSFQKRWETSCSSAMKIYKITGDHTSIFNMPHVAAFARTFARVLKNL